VQSRVSTSAGGRHSQTGTATTAGGTPADHHQPLHPASSPDEACRPSAIGSVAAVHATCPLPALAAGGAAGGSLEDSINVEVLTQMKEVRGARLGIRWCTPQRGVVGAGASAAAPACQQTRAG
jgi:hypothetical protein